MNRHLLILLMSLLTIGAVGAGPAKAQSRPSIKVAFVHDREVAGLSLPFKKASRSLLQ